MMYARSNREHVPKVRLKLSPMKARKLLYLSICALLHSASCNRPPRFLIDGQSEVVIRVKEGPETAVGTLLYRLKAYDPDGDALQFSIREQGGSDVLRLEPKSSNEVDIYLAKELDREIRDEYPFVLTLTDGHLGEGNYVTQSLLLLVEDVNDNEPLFRPYPAAITVREDASPGVLLTVEASDSDEGAYGQVVYSLQELDGDVNSFSISTVNGKGVVRLTKRLDYERKSLYQLRVLATDRANQGRVNTGTAAILVKVLDVEDKPPEFVIAAPVTRISEDSPLGTSVLQVRALDGDRGVNNRISYSILGGGEDLFDIDSISGVVYTVSKLDRETGNGAYILEILATEESESVPPPTASTEVTVMVTDVNDERPVFRSARYACEVPENAQQNTPLTFLQDAVPEVYDYDQGKNGTFELYLVGDNGVFDVTPFRGVNEATFLIRVNDPSSLDFEFNTVMNFSLVAKEVVAVEPKMSVVPITVHIRDENDNSPEFTEPVFTASIPENCGAGTTVAWVQALDPDSDNYGTRGVRYTGLSGAIAHVLHLNPVSGVITVRQPGGEHFDRELVSTHYLTVEARDDLGRGNRNTAQLIVHIEDENDNAPTFVASKYEARLLENEERFESPLVLEARDIDLNGTRNSEIEYSIVDGDYKNNFTIDPKSGVLRPRGSLDFELIPGDNSNTRPVHLIVRARDRGAPSLASEVPVTVYVQDANDHAPLFNQVVYQRAVPEDLPGGTAIVEVKARDADGSAPNNRVVYRIQRGAGDKFVIGAESGVVAVASGGSLDPDRTAPKTRRYTLTVVALDGGIGEQQLSAAVLVNISIADVNNKPPAFDPPGAVSVRENTQVGAVIYRAVARDPDERPVLRYSVHRAGSSARDEDGLPVQLADYDYLSVFDLNAVDGTLRVVRLLDREKVETVKLGLMVEDVAAVTAGPRQTATAVLSIVVEDENDNSPVFRRPHYRATLAENAQRGASVVRVAADDADKNRTITYYLEGPEEILQLVRIERDTGEVVVAGRVDHEAQRWLNCTVRAVDSGAPPRDMLASLSIQVLDENDNNPYFEEGAWEVSLREDVPPGTVVATAAAEDADSGEYGRLTYLLGRQATQGKFLIDPQSGALSTSEPLDRERQAEYALVVEAWDNYQLGYHSGESRNAFKQLRIKLEDVNDNPPVVDWPVTCATVTEFHNRREPVTSVRASDADDSATPNGRVRFNIVGGTGKDLFYAEQVGDDSNTALIYARHSLQDRFGNYSLQVEASDLGAPPNTVRGELRVCVTDYNDHAPVFVSPPRNVTVRVPENATLGSTVVQARAIDADTGPNGAVRYRVRADAAGDWRAFSVHALSGAVTLARPLDREKQLVYQIRLEAYDLGTPTPLSSDLDLTIYVRPVDSYAPRFTQREVRANFTEAGPDAGAGPGVELPAVVERDEMERGDEPVAAVCYYVVGGDPGGVFSLDKQTRRLTTYKPLDRETQPHYRLLVRAAEDCAKEPQPGLIDDSVLSVLIDVTDVNDNSPVFESKTFTGGVSTEADFGTVFMHVKATDADEGVNANISYWLEGEVRRTLSEGLDDLQAPPFAVDRWTGAVTLNFDPQKGMKGYFDFKVRAEDAGGLADEARVFIYLLREDQRVRFVLRTHPAAIRERIAPFRDELAKVLGCIVNTDELRVHENRDGSVDVTRTDLYLHLVGGDHSVMEAARALALVDSNIERLDALFKEFNVLDTQPAEWQPLAGARADQSVFWLAWSCLLLGVLLALCLLVCLSQRADYARRLKAATATSYASVNAGNSDMTIRSACRVPNTNKHSTQGSNPVWLQAYETDWYKNDGMSQSERDSLDENVVDDASNEKPYMIATPAFANGDFDKYNLYQIDVNRKSMETTEL